MLNEQAMTPLALTVEEGNNLLQIASGFACPESLGEGQKYNNSERVLANNEVATFFWGLREKSPILRSKKRLLFFGPEEAYEETTDPATGKPFRKLVDPYVKVDLELDEKQIRGLIWCLLVRLHPMSSAISGAGEQITLVWPVARKVEVEEWLREQIGLDKATPKVIKRDGEYRKKGNGNGSASEVAKEAAKA